MLRLGRVVGMGRGVREGIVGRVVTVGRGVREGIVGRVVTVGRGVREGIVGRVVTVGIVVSAGGVVMDDSLSCMWHVSCTAMRSLVEEEELGVGERETCGPLTTSPATGSGGEGEEGCGGESGIS